MSIQDAVNSLNKEIARLTKIRDDLQAGLPVAGPITSSQSTPGAPAKKKRVMSAATRKKISEARKRTLAAKKKATAK